MRYIGNKTRLLGFIGRVLRARGIARGRAADPFSGTASVAAALKRHGFAVHASDVMEYAYVFARAYVQTDAARLCRTLPDRLRHLNALAPQPGFIHRHFTPAGSDGALHGRMYFTPANGARIDAIRDTIEQWRRSGEVDADTGFVLLAALIEAADRVANTTGVYAAFVKSWQPNARRPLALRLPGLQPGNGCHAERGDAAAVVRRLGEIDLLYLDPPYNGRQYPGYYHIPEILATGWYDGAVEPQGKTGLVKDPRKRSDWSRRRHAEAALAALLEGARARHIVMSYNSEGLIPESAIERLFRDWGRSDSYRRYHRGYRRYRSDADGAGRRYTGDRVREYLYCITR